MKHDISFYLLLGLLFVFVAILRYLLMTGLYYLVVYKVFKKKLLKFKINPQTPPRSVIKEEIKWAIVNKINFGIWGVITYICYEHGLLKMYFDISTYGIFYFIGIIPALLVLHDAYFFWSHYLMHRPFFKKLTRHDVHHHFHNVSPWSAFSVHPFEGFVEVLFRPLTLLFIPMHPATLIIFEIISFSLNIIGHSGYEFFPSGFTKNTFTRMKSCSTFHYMHHKNGNYNFSLFLNYWDRIMGTLHPDYDQFFEKTAKNNKIKWLQVSNKGHLILNKLANKELGTK